jgi:hypothetical protein
MRIIIVFKYKKRLARFKPTSKAFLMRWEIVKHIGSDGIATEESGWQRHEIRTGFSQLSCVLRLYQNEVKNEMVATFTKYVS